MIAVSTTELRKHLRKYLNIAKTERVFVQCGSAEQFEIVPTEVAESSNSYFSNPQVVKAIERGRADVQAGRVTRNDPKDPWAIITNRITNKQNKI